MRIIRPIYMLVGICLGIILIAPQHLLASQDSSDWQIGRESKSAIKFDRELDSLQNILNAADSDSARVDVLTTFSKNFFNQSTEIALNTANKALALAQEIHYQKGEIVARHRIGAIQVNLLEDYARGLAHLTEAQRLLKQHALPDIEVNVLHLTGFLYYRQELHERAVPYFKKAISVAERNQMRNQTSNLRSYLAEVYEKMDLLDSALVEYEKILETEKVDNFENAQPASIMAVARLFYLKKDYSQVEKYYTIGLKNFRKKDNHRWVAYTMSLIADLQIQKGTPEAGIPIAQEGLELASSLNLTKEMVDCHHVLSVLHDTLGNYQAAFFHYKAETEINKRVFNLEKAKQIANVQASYEEQMRIQELEQVKREKEMSQKRSRIITLAGAMGILLLGLLAAFWYSAYRQKKRVNDQLEDRVELKNMALDGVVMQLRQEIDLHKKTQERLATTYSELNHFIYKSSHDLKGPLATIIGLSDIAYTSTSETDRQQYLEMIRVSSSRLSQKLDALIHATRLTEGPLKVSKMNLAAQVREIVDELKLNDFASDVGVEIAIDPTMELLTDRHLCGSLLSSLIENAMQYKDPGKAGHFVKIRATKEGNGVNIKVSDNGRGIPKSQMDSVFDMFVKSNMEFQGSGLGLYLAKKTAYKLGGSITLESEEKVGTTACIFFPEMRTTLDLNPTVS